MWQLGEATILNESGHGGDRRTIYAIAGTLLVAMLVLAVVIWRQQTDDSSAAENDIYSVAERAFQLTQAGEWASAQRLANDVLSEDPDVPVALYARGKAREQLGKIADALADYNRAVDINPSFHLARFDAINLRYIQGESPRGLRDELERLLLKLDSRDPELVGKALILALRLDIADKNWPRARKTLKDAQALAGGDSQVVLLAGQIPAGDEGAEAKSVAAPTPVPAPTAVAAQPPASKPAPKPAAPAQAAKASPKDEAKQLHEKGIAFYRKGYLRNARRTLEDATQLDAQNDEIWVDLGRVLVELGEDREAMQVFTTAGKIDPRNPRVWNNLGSLYMYQGDDERAKKAFETYLSLVPATSAEAREIKRVLDNL
jgi:superkiller protein 3